MEGSPFFEMGFGETEDARGLCAELRAFQPRVRRPGDRAQLAPWQVKLAMEIMSGQTNRALSLADVALPLGVSVNHFIKGFVNTVGTSPYHWFIRQRIVRAVELLRDSDLPLAEIAAECGFSDQSHFTRVFSRHMSTTPGKWRRMERAGEGHRARFMFPETRAD
jgi:AraC family transcriptional regulator